MKSLNIKEKELIALQDKIEEEKNPQEKYYLEWNLQIELHWKDESGDYNPCLCDDCMKYPELRG